MKDNEITNLINSNESAKLDFKKEWYKNTNKNNEEIIKDFVALANGNLFTIGQPAYLLIGVEEIKNQEKILHDIMLDEDLPSIKKQILQNLKNYTQPPIIDFDIDYVTINNRKILAIRIPQHPYIIKLNKNVHNIYRIGDVLYRSGKSTEVATPEFASIFQEKLSNYRNHNNTTTSDAPPTLKICLKNEKYITNHEEIKIILEEISLILINRRNNLINLSIDIEEELYKRLNILSLNDSLESKKEALEIKRILSYIEPYKENIELSILLLLKANMEYDFDKLADIFIKYINEYSKLEADLFESTSLAGIFGINYEFKYSQLGSKITKFDTYPEFNDYFVVSFYSTDDDPNEIYSNSSYKNIELSYKDITMTGMIVSELPKKYLDDILLKYIDKMREYLSYNQISYSEIDKYSNILDYRVGLG